MSFFEGSHSDRSQFLEAHLEINQFLDICKVNSWRLTQRQKSVLSSSNEAHMKIEVSSQRLKWK